MPKRLRTVERAGVRDSEDQVVERDRRIGRKVDRENVAALHSELLDQLLRQWLGRGRGATAIPCRSAGTLGGVAPAGLAAFERLVAVEAAGNRGLAVGADDHEAADIRLHLLGDHRGFVVERIVGAARGIPAGLELGGGGLVVLVERLAFGFERRDRLEQLVSLDLFLVGERCRFEMDLVEVFGRVVGDTRLEDRAHPGIAGGLGDLGRKGLELLAGNALGDLGIDPGLAAILGEEVALDLAAGGEVVGFACELRHRRGRADRAVRDHAADGIGVVALPAVRQFVPDHHLAIMVGRRRIGLGDVEGDLAFLERGEDRIGKVGKPQAAFDEPAGAAEPLGDRVEVAALVDEVLVGADLVGRGHVEPDDVLDQRELGLLGGIDVEDAAGDGVILGELARGREGS